MSEQRGRYLFQLGKMQILKYFKKKKLKKKPECQEDERLTNKGHIFNT